MRLRESYLSPDTMGKKGGVAMAQAVNVNFRMDADLKKSMEQAGMEKRIPFEVSVDPFYSESNMCYLEKIANDVAQGKAHFAEHELAEEE